MIKRRIFAAIALIGFAIGSAFYRSGGETEWFSIASHLAGALLGFVFLHYRWRAREKRLLTPDKAKDIFS